MNYNRRANRPDGNHYRDMRRRGLKQADEGLSFRRGGRRTGWGAVVLAVLAAGALVAWLAWR
jgi:hypothetical protein